MFRLLAQARHAKHTADAGVLAAAAEPDADKQALITLINATYPAPPAGSG